MSSLTSPALQAPGDGRLADLLDWSTRLGDDPPVIGTKTGRLLTTLRATCPDTVQMADEARAWYLAGLHGVLAALDEGWSLDADWWHEEAPAYPASTWDHPVDWLVDEVRRLDCETRPRYTTTTYLTLGWTPPTPKRRWLREVFLTKPTVRAVQAAVDDDIDRFQQAVRTFANLLAPAVREVVFLDKDATCTYLHHCVSWYRYAVRCPSPSVDLDVQLSDSVFLPGQPPQLGDQLIQPLTIASWQPELGTWLPELLHQVAFPCHWHVRWVPMGVKAATHFLKWEEKRWANKYKRVSKQAKQATGTDQPSDVEGRDVQKDAIAAGQSLLDTQEEVLLGQEVLGTLSATLLCWAPDQATLDERVRVLQGLMFQQGLVARVEDAGASLAWLASLPGHVQLGTRGLPLRTQELTALVPHSTRWAGVPWNGHLKAPAVIVAQTGTTPFHVTTHVGELGLVKVLGPTRSGKSGFLGLLTGQWFRYRRARCAIYDRDNALKAATLLRGGTHYALGTPGCQGFQPLGRLDTAADRQWALTWIEGVLTGEGLPPTPEEREALWQAVQLLATVPQRERTLSVFRQLMQVQRLKIGLAPFCTGGPYSFFDANADAFSLNARLVCFEMGGLLTMPRAIGPTLAYLTHCLETQWFTGDPVQLIIDEAKWLLGLERFLGDFEVWLKARAKKNVSVTVAVQEIFDLQQTNVWQAIIASMPTTIALPNQAAGDPDVRPLYHAAGIGDAAIAQLVQAQPLRDYLYHSPLGTQLFQLTLSPVERLLCAASRLDELAVLDQLVATTPPDALPAVWLRHWGFHEEAAVLDTLKENYHAMDAHRGTRPDHNARVYERGPVQPLDAADDDAGDRVLSASAAD